MPHSSPNRPLLERLEANRREARENGTDAKVQLTEAELTVLIGALTTSIKAEEEPAAA